MVRVSTIFIAICMVLVAASLGLVLNSLAGIGGVQSAIVALATLTFLVLYNAVSMRLRDRTDVSGQIGDLSRGTADLARQIAEFGRRLAAVEGKVISGHSTSKDRVQTALDEIGELGVLVKQLAVSVAAHEDLLSNAAPQPAAEAPAPESAPAAFKQPAVPAWLAPVQPPVEQPAPQAAAVAAPPTRGDAQLLAAVKGAVEANRIDIYLQPIVTLPQRKVRFYEAVTRLRDNKEQILTAEEFVGVAENAGLISRIDHAVMLRCMQVLRRLLVRNKDVGVFCNVSAATLSHTETFVQCLDFLEANRALAASFILEFKQSAFRNMGPLEMEHLAALAQRGFRFSLDHVQDLRFEPRDLADRGVRYIKVPASLLLDEHEPTSADIHPADLSDLLGRFGIDLIAERIEGERAVVDLLDYDVRFGQGFLFAAPRPLRPEAPPVATETATPANQPPQHAAQEFNGSVKTAKADIAGITPPQLTGNAALVRRAAGPV
jgi:cyclic-di-GMP phosphodiesterase TipF (flagellum assembly factor)